MRDLERARIATSDLDLVFTRAIKLGEISDPKWLAIAVAFTRREPTPICFLSGGNVNDREFVAASSDCRSLLGIRRIAD
jgi:hypothetical protein